MPSPRWTSAWPDLIAFALGLGVAWASGWTTTDLVWSLWLSSLVVGYSMIVWSIIQPVVELGELAWRGRAMVEQALATTSRGAIAMGAAADLHRGRASLLVGAPLRVSRRVYALVYALYFFPWGLLRRDGYSNEISVGQPRPAMIR